MSDFKTRLIKEQQELSERTQKLGSFIGGDIFYSLSMFQRVMLRLQSIAMRVYGYCLRERIKDLGI